MSLELWTQHSMCGDIKPHCAHSNRRQAADAAVLTPQQRAAICALRRSYHGNLGVLAARRRSLTAMLQVHLKHR
jgi:hypothetical protein